MLIVPNYSHRLNKCSRGNMPDNVHAENSGVTFPLPYNLQMFTRDAIITYAYIAILSRDALANIKANTNAILTVTNYSLRPKCSQGMCLTIFTLNIQV